MRGIAITALMSASLALTAAPAQAAWKSYVSHTLGFSVEMPGDVKTTTGTYRGAFAGPHESVIFRSIDDNIEYKVTVMSFMQAQADGATILGEREYMFQDGKKVLMDTFGRIEPGKDSIYGRKITIDLPKNGGRTTGAFYFNKGKLIALEATVLPKNGDYASPDPGRFIDSLTFTLARAQEGASELKLPE